MQTRAHSSDTAAKAAAPAGQAAAPRVGQARDPLEHEADRVATRLLAGAAGLSSGASADGGDGPGAAVAPSAATAVLAQPGQPLPTAERVFFESGLGANLSGVRIHTGPDADAAVRSVDAQAFTVGSDVVLGGAHRSPGTDSGRLLLAHELAHELVHVVQRRKGAADRAMLRRKPKPAPVTPEETARKAVRSLVTLQYDMQIATEKAATEFGRNPTLDEADRIAGVFNQSAIQQHLTRGKSVYETQHLLQNPNDAVVGELRVAYTDFLHAVRTSADAALKIAYRARLDVRQREEPAYGQTLVSWLAATGFRDQMLAGRAGFTPEEARASTTYEADLGAVLAKLPYVNLARPDAVAGLISALGQARSQVTPDATGHPTAQPLEPALAARVTRELDTVRAVRAVIQQSVAALNNAAKAVSAWVTNPLDPSMGATGAALQRFFRTAEPGYGGLLARRLDVMSRELATGGSLYLHFPVFGQPVCDTPNVEGESPQPYEVVLCGVPTLNTMLHEVAHAVVPGRGSRGRASQGARPLDRAAPGERLLTRLSTEEALANAESYAELVATLTGQPVSLIPSDIVTGCPGQDADRILDAVAWAQALIRRASTHIDEWRLARKSTGTYPAAAHAHVSAAFGADRTDVQIDAIVTAVTDIHRNATTWVGAAFTCEKDQSSRCPAGVVAATSEWTIQAGAVTKRATRVSKARLSVCPAFFQLDEAAQQRVALALMVLRFTNWLNSPEDVLRYGQLARDIWDIPPPPATGLTEHQATDQP